MNRTRRYSPEVRERTIRLGLKNYGEYDSLRVAFVSMAGKLGSIAETVRCWVRQADQDAEEWQV